MRHIEYVLSYKEKVEKFKRKIEEYKKAGNIIEIYSIYRRILEEYKRVSKGYGITRGPNYARDLDLLGKLSRIIYKNLLEMRVNPEKEKIREEIFAGIEKMFPSIRDKQMKITAYM